MITVKLKTDKDIDIDRALKILKNKINKTGILRELKDRKEYTKPSVIKRELKKNSIYKQKMIDKNKD